MLAALSRTPLIVRIFLTIFASILTVQLLNLILVITVRVPFPPIYSVGQVADAMRSGAKTGGQFRMTIVGVPVTADNQASRVLAEAIARRLVLPSDRVRVSMPTPPGSPSAMLERERRDNIGPPDFRYELMVGDFVASVRRADGRWLALRPVGSATAAWRTRALLWLLAALAVAAPLAWLIARQVTRPIRLFGAAAERLGREPHAMPIPPDGPMEIAPAIAAFNGMQTRLARYLDDRTAMMRAIAHDFRTPLMRLSLRLEKVPEPVGTRCRQDVAELEAMIAAVRGYVDAVSDGVDRRLVDLRSMAESIVDDLADQGATVAIDATQPVVVVADAAGVRQAIRNLVVNALQYAGDAEVLIESGPGVAAVSVRDHGPGIPAADLERVFEPFFRLESSRSRDTGGQGLGLASARALAFAHGGDVTLANHPEGGVLARFLLPLPPPASVQCRGTNMRPTLASDVRRSGRDRTA